ncbi:MAG: hypothetical protein KDB53_12465 [Planctomycetes bacterium]|nr:hypothetical protein [Planctomycetota bacterium]
MKHRFPCLAAFALVAVALTASSALAQVQSVGYADDFESFSPCGTSYSTSCALPNGWTNLSTDDHDWLPDVGGTTSSGTGPSVDHNPGTSSGIYLYTETSGGSTGVMAILESPRLDAVGVAAPRVNFWYHMLGSDMGTMSFDLRELFNEGLDGDANGTTFMSASANFNPAHVGTTIVISGSGAGNNGSYIISSWTSANEVEVSTPFAAAETGLGFIHQQDTADYVAPLSGNMGDTWFQMQVPVTLTRGGAIEQFQFIFRSARGTSFTSDMAIDDFSYDALVADDLALAQISAPGPDADAGSNASVTVEIANPGINAQSSFMVQYDVNASGFPVMEAYSGAPIASGSSAFFTFATPFVVAVGPNVIDATVLLAGDQVAGNDTASSTTNGIPTITSFPYSEDFEGGQGNWASSGTNDSWAFGTPAKPVINGADSGVNCWVTGGLTGQYPNNEQSQLIGPIFDFSALGAPRISLAVWWESEFSWDGLVLQSTIDGGATWNNVGAFGDANNWYNDNTINSSPGGSMEGWSGRSTTSNGSGGWVTAQNILAGLGGQSNVRLRFAFSSDGSVQWEGVAIDTLLIDELPQGAGQGPQPGLAVFDLSNSVDVFNGIYGVDSGVNGPYQTTVAAGAPLNFHFEGTPIQAIFLLSGPTNVGLMTYAGIGQFDIGTGLDMAGLPTGLTVVIDATAGGFPDSFFVTNAGGTMDATLAMPVLPPGYVTTFQGAVLTGSMSVVALTNAIELYSL